MRLRTCAILFLSMALVASAQEWLDRVDDALAVSTQDGKYHAELSGTFDLEGYFFDSLPPGLLFADESFVNPRLSLFLDAHLGQHFYLFVQGRLDRGFDAGANDFDARFDEYLLRYIPGTNAYVNFQVGKFATVVGNWVPRHDSWNNPFINAPLPYENVTTVADLNLAPGPTAFLARRDIPDRKTLWLPVIWGPDYTSGGSIFGTIKKFDYAFEFKNASLSSRPAVWDGTELGWEYPTVSGRLGYRPEPAWNLGVSFSRGTYLQPDAEHVVGFPAGKDAGDFLQTTFGADASFAWRHWEFWGEVFLSRFDVPNVAHDADTLAYYLEAKYKITTRLFGAVRWNQQFFNDVPDGAGQETPWDRNAYRVDAALGYRFNRHWQGKVQYSFNHHDSVLQQGDHLGAVQLTLKF